MKNEKTRSILFVANQLIYGGAERYTVSVANEFVRRGARVTVISSGGPMKSLLNKKVKHYFAPVRKTNILARLRTIQTILFVSWKERVDVIHTQSTSGSFAARVAKIFTGTPIIKTAHGYPDGSFPSVARTLNYSVIQSSGNRWKTTIRVAVSCFYYWCSGENFGASGSKCTT